MAIKKKKPRKKRQAQVELPPTAEDKAKVQFRDEFQKGIGQRIEDLGSKLEGKGRQVIYGLSAFAILLVFAALFYAWNQRTANAAKAALGDAIKISQAQVTDVPLPAGATLKTFKTEKARAEAAIKEFQAIINNYGSPYAEKAKYFIAVNRLVLDRDAGEKELEALAASNDDVGMMSRFALAQAKAVDGEYEDAAKFYTELSQAEDPVLSKETIVFELAKLYEKQDKKKKAVELYFKIAKEAGEAKDAEGNSVPLTQTAIEARERLEELDPEKAKQIKGTDLPPTGFPSGA